jgi:hypothetical protein
MVKDLVRTKKSITKFIELKTHLNAVGLKLQVNLSEYDHRMTLSNIAC